VNAREAGYAGGRATLERHGIAHFKAIARGRKRIPRYSERRVLAHPGNAIGSNTGGEVEILTKV
jgi:hypothetical protein